jgi:GxxExxY protein
MIYEYTNKKVKKDIILPELTYQIVGILFEVWNSIGYSHKEVFYQKAIARIFKERSIPFQEQVKVKLKFKGDDLGVYFLDFLIQSKVILEIKKREYFSKQDIDQLFKYLQATGLQLGIIAHFTRTGVKFKRVVNLK